MKLAQKHPIDASVGEKEYLGTWIKTAFHKKQRFFRFTARQKATQFQLQALVSLVEGKCPPIGYLTFDVLRKRFEHVDIKSFDSLMTYIQTSLYTQRELTMHIHW